MKLDNHKYFNSREISWVDFNFRVLGEATDPSNPLLERLRFLGITQSNFDEFFNVRVATLLNKIAENDPEDAAGNSPAEQLRVVLKKAHQLVKKQGAIFNEQIQPKLANQKIKLKRWSQLTAKQRDALNDTFQQTIFPIITPMAIDTSRPFPFLKNGSINIAVQSQPADGRHSNVIIPINDALPRVIPLGDGKNQFILIEEVVQHFLSAWFPKDKIEATALFRITRDMDIDVNDKQTTNYKDSVETTLQERTKGPVVRLETTNHADGHLIDWLITHYQLDHSAVFYCDAPLDLNFVNDLIKQITGHQDLLFPPFEPYDPKVLNEHSMFDNIKKSDILVHHPYDSFNPVVRFIQEAAQDEQTISIKMTLYRVSKNSPIIKALQQAAENGKDVTVMVELKARFDEGNNLHWTNELQAAGCNVIYGLQGLKVHCKLSLIVRKESSGVKRYMHLATGNYNDKTAKLYTDMGIFTANPRIGQDATKIFNMLSGSATPPQLDQLVISPNGIRNFLMHKIDQEIANARAGKPAGIKMKMNSFSDTQMIEKLYEANAAGVKTELIIRGICNLRTGIKGVSDHITIHSIVGQLLEHSRIYIFRNDDQPQVYLSSADLMKRNLSRRVEILFPVLNPILNQSVLQIFKWFWSDNVKTRKLHANDEWHHLHNHKKPFNIQSFLIQNRQAIADQRLQKTGFNPNPPLQSTPDQFKPIQ